MNPNRICQVDKNILYYFNKSEPKSYKFGFLIGQQCLSIKEEIVVALLRISDKIEPILDDPIQSSLKNKNLNHIKRYLEKLNDLLPGGISFIGYYIVSYQDNILSTGNNKMNIYLNEMIIAGIEQPLVLYYNTSSSTLQGCTYQLNKGIISNTSISEINYIDLSQHFHIFTSILPIKIKANLHLKIKEKNKKEDIGTIRNRIHSNINKMYDITDAYTHYMLDNSNGYVLPKNKDPTIEDKESMIHFYPDMNTNTSHSTIDIPKNAIKIKLYGSISSTSYVYKNEKNVKLLAIEYMKNSLVRSVTSRFNTMKEYLEKSSTNEQNLNDLDQNFHDGLIFLPQRVSIFWPGIGPSKIFKLSFYMDEKKSEDALLEEIFDLLSLTENKDMNKHNIILFREEISPNVVKKWNSKKNVLDSIMNQLNFSNIVFKWISCIVLVIAILLFLLQNYLYQQV